MPEATAELRNLMNEYFGDPIDDSGPYQFLTSLGYTEGAGLIRPPPDFKEFDSDRTKEWHCVMFLIQEWDYAWESTTKPEASE
jgi:hypothetical protein